MSVTINSDNWFWCDVCENVSYIYGCECHGSLCNAGGCDKCHELSEAIRELVRLDMIPSKEFAIKNNLKRWGDRKTPERRLMESIFSKTE